MEHASMGREMGKVSKNKNLIIDTNKFNALKDSTPKRAIDLGKSMLSGYSENLWLCVKNGKKQRQGNFFVVVLRKREALSTRIIRSLFLHRQTCPTPNYDQNVYHYDRKADELVQIWVIPDRETCFLLRDNALEAMKTEKELLKYVLDFADGTLDKKMTELNGEKEYSLELTEEKLKELKKI